MRKREVFNFRITAYLLNIPGLQFKKTELSVYNSIPSRNVTQARVVKNRGYVV